MDTGKNGILIHRINLFLIKKGKSNPNQNATPSPLQNWNKKK